MSATAALHAGMTATSQPQRLRKLRVLTLTPFYPSQESPSEGCFVSEVLPWTGQFEIENDVIALRPFYRGKVHAVQSQVPCALRRYFSVPGNTGLPMAGWFAASRLLDFRRRLHQYDLIHAHAALPCGHAAAILHERLGIPFVVTVHGLDAFSDRQARGTMGAWCRRISQQVYRRARAVICISEAVKRQLGDLGRTKVVYNGVDGSRFAPEAEQDSPRVVLSVGNLIPSKGHALLLRAWAQIASEIPDCELHIIGEGRDKPTLIALSQTLGISKRVCFLGGQDRASVAAAMKSCTVFALPSTYEGLGCVYLEAMASGKPAIACKGQGIAEIIQHGTNGLLVPPGEQPALKDALIMLLRNADLRRRIGKAARETVLKRYTLEHQAEQLTQLYRECVA